MSGETVSLLLRPQCLPAAHHAAVTSVLFLDDVELLRDCSPQSAVSQVSSFEGGAALPDNTTTTSSWLAALSQPGSTVHRPARSLVTASRDATIRLWHVREEEEEGAGVRCCGVLEGHTEWVSDLCLLQRQAHAGVVVGRLADQAVGPADRAVHTDAGQAHGLRGVPGILALALACSPQPASATSCTCGSSTPTTPLPPSASRCPATPASSATRCTRWT